jgi:hypothetical protein
MCDRDDAAIERLISRLEKAVLDLLVDYDREHRHTWDEHRARELVKQWLAPRGKAVPQ